MNKRNLYLLSFFALALLFISACQQAKQPACVDECSEERCSNSEYVSCVTQGDGCKHEVNEGVLKGKCDVECTSKLDCEQGMACSENYQCVAPKPMCGNGIQEAGEICSTCPADAKGCSIKVCGDKVKSSNENCGNCPSDAGCGKGESCIDNDCVSLDWFKGEFGQWCKWIKTESKSSQLDISTFGKSFSTCGTQDSSSKMVDERVGILENAWYCKTKDGSMLPFPVVGAVELKKLTNINKVQLLQSGIADDWSAKEVEVFVSADSTNGNDGHWKKVAVGSMPSSNLQNLDIVFTPISARWVKVSVAGTWEAAGDKFAMGEMKVYESDPYCEDKGPGPLSS